MKAVVCPGCGTELDPTNTNCPVCLRPRSRKELLEGLKDSRRPPPTRWGRVLLGLAAAGAAAYGGLAFLHRPLPPATAQEPPPADAPLEPSAAAPMPAVPAPEEPAPPVQPSGTVTVRRAPVPARPERPANHRRPAAAAKPARPKGWDVHGLVYDLLSLKPVAGAKVVFQDKESGRAFTAACDEAGRYRVDLPKLDEGGYEVTLAARGYRGVYLEEMSPPYRSQGKARRLEAVDQYSESAVLHVPLLPELSATDVPYDLVLFR